MRPRTRWSMITAGVALSSAPIPIVAYAETYLTEDQAALLLFPDVGLKSRWLDLTSQEVKAIEDASDSRLLTPRLRVWSGPKGETVFIDRVLGKHEYIDYAVAIAPDEKGNGRVEGIEIMEYRETYGNQVREKEWQAQFLGKTKDSPLKVNKDIRNISGATLSSVHVTAGVRRVLWTYETIKNRLR